MGRTWPIPNNDTTLYCNSLYVTSLGCVVITMNGENLQADKRKRRVVRRRIPKEVVENVALNRAIGRLPANYNFEIHKSVWRIQEEKAETVALQFPEGLLMYACVVSDILEQFANCQCVILGDVTYGACCIDDLTAEALGCSLLIHYGHSCLVPIAVTAVKVLYVFVEISIDTAHLAACIRETFPATTKLVVMGTIQFAGAVHEACRQVVDHFDEVTVPQAKPLSPGEVLGCTSPVIDGKDALVFVADGRFHLESAMIHNPNMQHFRYNPYTKALTREGYDTKKMHALRKRAIEVAQGAKSFGVILGTLGRQGNPHILEHLTRALRQKGKQYFVLLLSEIFPAKLAAFDDIEAWIQVACPRLSIDWGHFFSKPLLSPYEADVALGETAWRDVYPMDFYANGSGAWTNQHEKRVS
ncbi:unnamed protein product [Ascophyllum nodosum]